MRGCTKKSANATSASRRSPNIRYASVEQARPPMRKSRCVRRWRMKKMSRESLSHVSAHKSGSSHATP